MVNDLDLLAKVYEIILAWPDNENAPDGAANDNQGHPGKEFYPFRSLSKIITYAAGEVISNETE